MIIIGILKLEVRIPWFLYLIECEDGSIYTGITVDVMKRYSKHVQGKGARYTRSHPPKKLLLSLEFPDRSSAAKAEYRVKRMPAKEKRKISSSHFIFSPFPLK